MLVKGESQFRQWFDKWFNQLTILSSIEGLTMYFRHEAHLHPEPVEGKAKGATVIIYEPIHPEPAEGLFLMVTPSLVVR